MSFILPSNIRLSCIISFRITAMPDQQPMTKEQVIQELRREADELDNQRCGFAQFAQNAYKAKIRRNLADRLERELSEENSTKNNIAP